MKTKQLGIHVVMDAWGSPAELLNDQCAISKALKDAVELGNAELIKAISHKFTPQGVTALAILAESHAAIHTWPEFGFFAADFFFCGNKCNPYASLNHLKNSLEANEVNTKTLKRYFEKEKK